MKSALISVIILLSLIICAVVLSYSQSKVLSSIYDSIIEMDKNPSTVQQTKQKIDNCIKKYTDNGFIIELTVPNDEYDYLHSLLQAAYVCISGEDFASFTSYIEKCKIYLSSMMDYSKVSWSNIL